MGGSPGSSAAKESVCNAGDPGVIPGLGRYPGEGNSYPLQYSGLENSLDCVVHWVSKSRTRLNDFQFHFRKFLRTSELYSIISIGDSEFGTDKESLLYEPAGAALMKYLKNCCCLQQQKFISHCVGGWAVQFKVLADLVSHASSLLFPSLPVLTHKVRGWTWWWSLRLPAPLMFLISLTVEGNLWTQSGLFQIVQWVVKSLREVTVTSGSKASHLFFIEMRSCQLFFSQLYV